MSLDYTIIIVLALAVLVGLFNGFIYAIGGLAGLVLGAWVGGRWYLLLSPWIAAQFNIDTSIANVIAFVVIFFAVSRCVALMFWAIKKLWHMLPFGKFTDHVLGACIGCVEGIIMIGLVLNFAGTMPLPKQWSDAIKNSKTAPLLITSSKILWPVVEKGIAKAGKALK